MALSQFKPRLTVSTGATEQGRGEPRIEVGGPLEIAAPGDYEHPIVVQFQVVQVPRGAGRDETKVKRVRGTGEEIDGDQWKGEIALGELVVGPADETGLETRGVAIAVLERKNQFAFDTITWCDEVELVPGGSAT